MRTGPTFLRGRARKNGAGRRDHYGSSAATMEVVDVYCGAQPKTRARSERCEGGCRSDAELREVGTEVIRSIARSSSKATVGSGRQIAEGIGTNLTYPVGLGRPMPFAQVSPTGKIMFKEDVGSIESYMCPNKQSDCEAWKHQEQRENSDVVVHSRVA